MEARVRRGNHSRSEGEALLDTGMQAGSDSSWDGKTLKGIPGDQKVSLGQQISLVCRSEHKHGIFFPQDDPKPFTWDPRMEIPVTWEKAWATQSCFTLACAANTTEHILVILYYLSVDSNSLISISQTWHLYGKIFFQLHGLIYNLSFHQIEISFKFIWI